MDDSILKTTKSKVSVMNDDENFDSDIIDYINSAFAELTQLGVGPMAGFRITGSEETWSDYDVDIVQLEMAKQYVFLYVRLIFDAPTNSTVLNYMKAEKEKLEWRLKVQAEEV